MRITQLLALALLLPSGLAWSADPTEAQDKKKPKLTAETLSGLTFRNIGPAFMSGRIADLAIDPRQPNTWYMAVGSGNLWKTTNAGTTWNPIFDNYGSYSIGCVTVDPNSRHTIWVGTGESVGGRHVGYGDGIYKSVDGGQSFKNMGLKRSEHIAKILVDPRDSQVVYAAAQGPLWALGGERGLYKTTNGGTSWESILSKGPYTGVTDIALDPRNPDVLFAATHQRHRTVWALVNGGPESGLWKSTDAGRTWRALNKGLPEEDKGKIGLAVSPMQPDVVYASIELARRTGGFWRSADGGESWTKMSDQISGGTGPHYYQEVYCDPHRFDVVYQADVRLARTEDGGKTWNTVEGKWKHVDNHAVAFHPHDPDFLLVGCDGGLYRSFDRGGTYEFFPNLPLTQFYKLDVDYDEPFYHIVGGTQDNATQYGPSRTASVSGIRNSDWRITIGGDGHDCAIDPEDPNIIYCESQQGHLKRYDRRTGESVSIRPLPKKGEEDLRFNWDSPVLISPHSNTRLYYGSKKLHRSEDRGDSWTTISPDLSRNQDRYKLKVMERVWSIDAGYDTFAMSQYGNITSIAESPLQEGLLYVGTDDGLIQISEDGGRNWRQVDRIYGIPEFSFVNDIKADLHDANTVYAVLDNHKEGDFKPYLIKSTDRGHTWISMSGDLPDRHILWRIIQDHVKKELFFLGSEFGLFFTPNAGTNWIKLTGNVPTIPFRDLEIQRRENDLVGASFGRSFFVLDDYTPLRLVSETGLVDEAFVLFPVRKGLLYLPARPLGGEKGSQGDRFHTAPNPPFGAVFTYYLRDSLKTMKKLRQEKEAKIRKEGGDNVYPGWDQLKKETQEEAPVLLFTIRNEAGQVVRKMTGPTGAGFHRIAWDLRYPGFTADREDGPLVIPGKYTVSAESCVNDRTTSLGASQTFEVAAIGQPALPVPDRSESLAFEMQVGELWRAVDGGTDRVQEALAQVAAMKKAVRQSQQTDSALFDSSRELELRLIEAKEILTGDPIRPRYDEPAPLSIRAWLRYALSATQSTYGPTRTQRESYALAAALYQEHIDAIRKLVETDLVELQRKVEAAGVPWTQGRPMPVVHPFPDF